MFILPIASLSGASTFTPEDDLNTPEELLDGKGPAKQVSEGTQESGKMSGAETKDLVLTRGIGGRYNPPPKYWPLTSPYLVQHLQK